MVIDRLSTEQHEAVHAGHPRFTVVASAGSGKTRVLVERYIRLVEEGVPPERLVTITYTNKAAANMKKRIVERLLEEGLRRQAQSAETGPVQTIHSFCERVLRSNAMTAGVDPQFTVMMEDDVARVRLDAVHDVLRRDLADMPDAQAFIDEVGGESSYFSTRLDTSVSEYVITVLNLRSTLLTLEELRSWSGSAEAVLTHQSTIWNRLSGGKVPVTGDAGELTDALQAWKRADRKAAPWGCQIKEANELKNAQMTAGLMQLGLRVWERMEAVMEARQTLDFALLERKTLALMRDPETAEVVRGQVSVVLVDEGQDLNPTQFTLLDALGVDNEMVVGDPRQSIYGFRDADVELFRQRLSLFPKVRLGHNYRSVPGLIRFIDRLYETVSGEHEESPVDPGQSAEQLFAGEPESCEGAAEILSCENGEFAVVTARRIDELLHQDVGAGEVAVLCRTGASCAQVAKELRETGVPASVVGGSKGLLTNVEVLDVANVLEALIEPTNDFALVAVLLSPFVGLSLDSVVRLTARRPVYNGLDTAHLEDESAREKLAAFRHWFDRQARLIDRATAWETVAALYSQTPFLNGLARQPDARQALANVRRLLTMAAKEPDIGPVEFAQQIRELRTTRSDLAEPDVDDDSQGAVQIMTIHKAKGLEFPHVFVPDMHAKLRTAAYALADPRLGIVDFGLKNTAMASHLKTLAMDRSKAELRRLLYVAVTRAKTKAYITLQASEEGLTPELARAIGSPPTGWPGLSVWPPAAE